MKLATTNTLRESWRAGAPDPLRRSSSEASRPEIVYCESCYNAEVV
jgi:hypothetical protein